ncbi:MAG: hypothetical protein Q9166_007417 [cf. Caloplaca sp. 2 TL-2023]
MLHRQVEYTVADNISFRKQLKDEVKQKKHSARGKTVEGPRNDIDDDAGLVVWELTVGLEIHAQLSTDKKLFSGKPKAILPLIQKLTAARSINEYQRGVILPALRAALALGCRINNQSQFDRKHYFYADQPAGYQITQYYQPFAISGRIILHDHEGIAAEDGSLVEIGIQQVQLEQDTAKTVLQPPSDAMLDFNRVSHPLIEIITLPQIHQPQTAAACVKKIQAILEAVNAVTTGMELGGLRADVNVSVRRKGQGQDVLGQRTEIKNLSSVKAVEDAILAERNRQISVLKDGGIITGETRGWTLGASDTVKLRGKEGEVDYRYMPDPDIGALLISDRLVANVAKTLPQLPDQITDELVQQHGLTIKDAKTLVDLDNGVRLDYFDLTRTKYAAFRNELGISSQEVGADKKPSEILIANWVIHEMGGLLSTSDSTFSPDRVSAKDLAYIILMLEMERITGRTAKQLLAKKFHGDVRDVQTIIQDENLGLVHLSDNEYARMARELLESNPIMVAQIKEKGQIGKLGFFMGQMMRKGGGKVTAQKAEATLKELLGLRKL